jgi:hypothetical protein
LDSINDQFKEFNTVDGKMATAELSVTKLKLEKIIDEIARFSEVVEILLIGSMCLQNYIDPNINSIKKMVLENNKIVNRNIEEFKEASKNYKDSLKEFINTKTIEKRVMINNKIDRMIKEFRKFEISIKRQVKSQKLVGRSIAPLKEYLTDIDQKQHELVMATERVRKSETDELYNRIKNLKDKQEELHKLYDHALRYSERQKEGSFEIAKKTLLLVGQFIEKANDYQDLFSNTLRFVSTNLESYSRFEHSLNELNTILVKIESNINQNNLKIQPLFKIEFKKEKNLFNKIIIDRNNNEIEYGKEYEQNLSNKVGKLDELLIYIERLSKIALIIELSLVFMNAKKGENSEMDQSIKMVEKDYKAGRYQESINNLVKIIELYKIKG